MTSFVNRVYELNIVDEAFNSLLSNDHLTCPIIDFYGIEGIGKTSILAKVIEKCDENKVPYIQADANQDLPMFSKGIIEQVRKYHTQLPLQLEESDERAQSVELTKALLEQGPLVMLLDAVDTTKENQIEQLEKVLSELAIYNKLLVILASRRSISFEHEKSVARKLTTVPVQPFDRTSSDLYLNNMNYPLAPEIRELIFEWTRGYPLAMDEMVQAIKEGINPAQQQNRKDLMTRIVDRVITKSLLRQAKPDEQTWLQQALSLLAVPRRFNLIIMQKLIEQFEPNMKLANSLAYFVLPKRIAHATGVIGWNLAKAGFAIDEPARNILLLQLKIGQPERYYEINRFLAQMYQQNASAVIGLDRIRYQREYLYHSANGKDAQQIPHMLEATVNQIIQDAENAPDQLVQFREEFRQDDELKDVLGKHANIVLNFIDTNLSQKMHLYYQQENDEDKRFRYLYDFFYYTVQNPAVINLASKLKEHIIQLLEKEDPKRILKLYEDLAADAKFKEALGDDFDAVHALIHKAISSEG